MFRGAPPPSPPTRLFLSPDAKGFDLSTEFIDFLYFLTLRQKFSLCIRLCGILATLPCCPDDTRQLYTTNPPTKNSIPLLPCSSKGLPYRRPQTNLQDDN